MAGQVALALSVVAVVAAAAAIILEAEEAQAGKVVSAQETARATRMAAKGMLVATAAAQAAVA